MTTFFTADHHFGHVNIIKLCGRSFKSADEMTRVMIAHWNEVVKPDDVVWHLGDMFSFKPHEMDEAKAATIAKSLHGDIHLLLGNHDVQPWLSNVIKVHRIPIIKAMWGVDVIMCHYPIECWEDRYHGSVHLHGHTHGSMKHKIENRFDVGVDCWDFRPMTLDQILAST